MTRINVGIDPKELPNKLLLAEHREITRIPNSISSGKAVMKNIPDKFTLGKGHVKFFYDKITFLFRRYYCLYQECMHRGFNVTDKSSSFDNIPEACCNDYEPTAEDRNLILERIKSKGFDLLNWTSYISKDYYLKGVIWKIFIYF